MKKKIIYFFFSLFIISFISLSFIDKKNIAIILSNYLPKSVYSTLLMIFDNERNSKRISNDYNKVFLPKTQYLKLNYEKKEINFLQNVQTGYFEPKKSLRKKFFIEIHKDDIFFMEPNGDITLTDLKDFYNESNNLKKINSNLTFNSDGTFVNILDFDIYIDKIFVSKVIKKNECFYLLIDTAVIEQDKFNFKTIFSTESNNECIKDYIQAGKIEILDEENLLLTTGADILLDENQSDNKPQDDRSLYGKILLINFIKNVYEIYNKGHRNSLGLLVDNNIILSTENGPKGGDEINLELKNKNYGWDIASYGEKYDSEEYIKLNDYNYNDHELNGFQEPIFTFIPSVGISEIIKLDNNFSKKWQNNYLIGSLYGSTLFRIKLDSTKTRLIYIEEIFIGERIRDLVYDYLNKKILLALESSGSIGILSVD